MSIESVVLSKHAHPLLFLPSIFPSIRVFSNELALCIRWPKYWSFSFSISPSSEYSGLISFRIDWFDLLVVQGTLQSLVQHNSKTSILWHHNLVSRCRGSRSWLSRGCTKSRKTAIWSGQTIQMGPVFSTELSVTYIRYLWPSAPTPMVTLRLSRVLQETNPLFLDFRMQLSTHKHQNHNLEVPQCPLHMMSLPYSLPSSPQRSEQRP